VELSIDRSCDRATSFGVSRATAYRYRDGGIAVLAAQAQDLHTALKRVAADGWSHVILDGKLFDCDRLTETTPPTVSPSPPTTAPTTGCYAVCAGRANAGSRS
jgi:hypothetical protein